MIHRITLWVKSTFAGAGVALEWWIRETSLQAYYKDNEGFTPTEQLPCLRFDENVKEFC